MREWISEQGIIFYMFTVLTVAGFIACAIANSGYKRLIKEADNMDNANNRLVKYIKLKYSSFYKIGLKPNDIKAMVNRYMYKYRLGPFTLGKWAKSGMLAMGTIAILAVTGTIVRFYRGEILQDMYSMFATAFLGMLILFVQERLYCFEDKREAFRWTMYDYLSNYLKNKIEFGKTLSEKTIQQQSQAAATRLAYTKEPAAPKVYSKNYESIQEKNIDDEIDAKVVEDILKEFLN